MNAQTKTFIKLFSMRYLDMSDFEYEMKAEDKELAKGICKTLKHQKHSVTEYIMWLFDTYLPQNGKFCPPSIRFVSGAFCMSKFLYENKPRKK